MTVTREAMLDQWEQPSWWQRLTVWDVLWALLVIGGSGYAWWFYQSQMDGYEVAKHIRETHQKDVLPIIFITAHTGPKPLDKFMAAGAVGSLEKPIDPEVLKRKLSLFLSIYKQRQKKQAA